MKKILFLLLLVTVIIAVIILDAGIPKQGYYLYSHPETFEVEPFYYQNGYWFSAGQDSSDNVEWSAVNSVSQDLKDHWRDYYLGLIIPKDFPAPDFCETEYYIDHIRTNVYNDKDKPSN